MTLARDHFDFRYSLDKPPLFSLPQDAAKDSQRASDCAHLQSAFLHSELRGKLRGILAADLIQLEACQWTIALDGPQTDPVEIQPGLLCRRRLDPRLKPLLAKLPKGRGCFLFPDPHLALRQRSAVCRFHLARQFVVSLPCGLAH